MKSVFNFLFGLRKRNAISEPTISRKKPSRRKSKPSNNPSEVWRPVKDFEGFYEVSSSGNVRSVRRLIRSSNGRYRQFESNQMNFYTHGKDGDKTDLQVGLSKNGITSHVSVKKIVAYAFLGAEPTSPYKIEFKDGNCHNVSADNLFYDVVRSNSARKTNASSKASTKSQTQSSKTSTKRSKLERISQAEEKYITGLRSVGYTYTQIMKATGRSESTIRRVLRRNNGFPPDDNITPVQLRIL